MREAIKLNQSDLKSFPIPDILNLIILLSASAVSLLLLKICTVTNSFAYKILCGLLFSYTANTLFSLLHEGVHGHLNSNKKLNHLFGMICASFFPTGYSLQQAFHLSHHKNNRTENEQFDFIRENDNKFIKYTQWYCILTGLYWLFAVIGAFLILLVPNFIVNLISKSKLSNQTGADSMFARLPSDNYLIIRMELLFSIGLQLCIFKFINPSFEAYFICYGMFAINWSSLQYADHAFSALDPKEGAWNLRVNKITQLLFLNYHAHKIHHKNMNLPWLYLNQFVAKEEYKPRFISIYLQMWKGPKHIPSNPIEANCYHPAFTNLNGELTCLKEFYQFSKRHFRYFKIAVFIYFPAFIQFKKLRTFRYGFSLLQHIDDVMDGDRLIEGDPLKMIESIKTQIKEEIFEPTTTGILAAVLFKSIKKSKINKEELKTEVLTLIDIMAFDYKRRQSRLVLNEAELDNILTTTFTHSVNLAMILWQSDLRANEADYLIKTFKWCTVVRDFREDLELGIINIPSEILTEGKIKISDSTDKILSSEHVRKWINSNYKNAAEIIANSTKQLDALEGRKGLFLLRIFHNSMRDYHKNFHLIFPTI